MQQSLVSKSEALKKCLCGMDGAIIAFSGGVDSTCLLKVAHDVLGDKAVGVTLTSSLYPRRELDEARRLARIIGVRHVVVESDVMDIDGFSDNPPDRCYYCKKELFSKLREIAGSENIGCVLDATNYDDRHDHRPGMRAKDEFGVVSPLFDCRMGKDDIRALSKEMGLDTWDKPAFACLASRFPYGTKITRERLSGVGAAEDAVMDLGIKQVRVRYHGDVARIEVGRRDMGMVLDNYRVIVPAFKELGFAYVALDIEGYRAGSLNEVLVNGKDASGF